MPRVWMYEDAVRSWFIVVRELGGFVGDFHLGGFEAGERVLDFNRVTRTMMKGAKLLALLEYLQAGDSI